MKSRFAITAIGLAMALFAWLPAIAAKESDAASCCNESAACCEAQAPCCDAGVKTDSNAKDSNANAGSCCKEGAACCTAGAACCG
jgi:hypothetical protein